MGRASRQKKARRVRRGELGLDRLALTGDARRDFERGILGEVELLSEIRCELAEFSPLSVVLSLSQLGPEVPDFARARLVREVFQSGPYGSTRMTVEQAASFALRIVNVWDEMVVDSLGTGTMLETMLGRFLSEQTPVQLQREGSLHRTLHVLYDPSSDGPLGPEGWRNRLNVDLPEFVLGVRLLAGEFKRGQLSLNRFLAGMPTDFSRIAHATIELLAGSCEEFAEFAPHDKYHQYDILPLAEKPIVRVDGDRLCAPAPGYIGLAASPAALYIRLLREDRASNTRRRSELAGHRYEGYLRDYCGAALGDRWTLIRLDEEAHPGAQIADLALFPADKSFLVLIETKMTLPSKAAQVGDVEAVAALENMYQKSFDQLESTLTSLGDNGFLEDAPNGVPTFGILATFDHHAVTVVDGRTHSGIAFTQSEPSSAGALARGLACAVLSAADTELLVDFIGSSSPLNVLSVLRKMANSRNPSQSMRRAVSELDMARREPNSVAISGLEMLAPAFESAELSALVANGIAQGLIEGRE